MTWEEEFRKITEVAHLHGVDPFFICAIRKQENGRAGREFGVLDGKSNTYDQQLETCVKTIRNYECDFAGPMKVREQTSLGFRRACYSPAFIAFAQRRYCPVGAANDPTGLNKNWLAGVTRYYARFCAQNSTAT